MKILLINGSPKTKQSASAALLADCKACFSRETEWRERHAARPVFSPEDADALSWADSVVFAFPLYADGIPSHLLSWLRQAEQSGSCLLYTSTIILPFFFMIASLCFCLDWNRLQLIYCYYHNIDRLSLCQEICPLLRIITGSLVKKAGIPKIK